MFVVLTNQVSKQMMRKVFVFFIDIKDESVSTRLYGFNKEDDRYYIEIKINEMVKVFNGSVKQINSKFNSIGNKFELRLNKYTIIKLQLNYNY